MEFEEKFIKKAESFRVKLKLSESDIEKLLLIYQSNSSTKPIKYKGLSIGKRVLTLELAETYPLIYGFSYNDIVKDDSIIPDLEDLPLKTQEFIQSRKKRSGNTVAKKGSKNIASHVVISIKDLEVGTKFSNFDIYMSDSYPLKEETSINWNKGILKGLVKNTGKQKSLLLEDGRTKTESIYEIVKAVDSELLEKALKSIRK